VTRASPGRSSLFPAASINSSAADEGRLVVHLARSLDGDLEPWEGDTFRIVWRDRQLGTSLCGFEVDGRGEVTGIKVEDYGSFRRQPASSGP
jgi:hypothetical protein